MAPAVFTTLRTVTTITPHVPRAAEAFAALSTDLLRAHKTLAARDDDSDSSDRHKPTVDPDAGAIDPHNINNVGFFVLFALIGVGFVLTGIWFFFWAKNGGFQFKENDWDDYKSTVLRRTGPNGTILSNVTPSTNLGGGSVYKEYADDDGQTVVTESTALSGITAGASDIASREKRRRKQEKRDRERAKRGKKTSRHVGTEGVEDDEAERAAKKELHRYRHEKAARVGGMNKESEGSQWDGSTNAGTESNVSTNLLSDRQTTPTTTPTKKGGGIRKVYSTADRRAERESERMRAEARRLREQGRSARRDFSYQRAESYSRAESAVSESLLESNTHSYVSGTTGETGSEVGTKSYHHPMPELRELERERARQERRARRAERAAERGYRRARTEEE